MTHDRHDDATELATDVAEELALAESSGPREAFAPGDETWRADPGETEYYESVLSSLGGAAAAELAATTGDAR